MGDNPQVEHMKETQEALRYQFVSTDLDLGLTFAVIARSTNDEGRAQRNLRHARQLIGRRENLLNKEYLHPK
jgi:hypothetical protein